MPFGDKVFCIQLCVPRVEGPITKVQAWHDCVYGNNIQSSVWIITIARLLVLWVLFFFFLIWVILRILTLGGWSIHAEFYFSTLSITMPRAPAIYCFLKYFSLDSWLLILFFVLRTLLCHVSLWKPTHDQEMQIKI